MGYFNRGVPAHRFLKDQIAKGNFGKITRVRASNCHSGELDEWFHGPTLWMTDPKRAGTGCFGDLGTHSLDLLMWLLDDDVEAAAADIKVVVGRYGKTDDCGEALLRFRQGTTAVIAASWVNVANPVSLEIAGTEGHAVIFNGQLFYQSKKVPGSDRHRVWKDLPRRVADPIDAFLDAVGGKKGPPLVTPAEAASRVRVMEAIYQAAQDHNWATPR